MSAELDRDLPLEIAHILFIDIVGYSKLLVNEQTELVQDLNDIVRHTGRFRAAEATGKLVRIPTGDGMALLFFENPEEPVQCALEISEALKTKPRIQLRMGAHSGPVNKVKDVNDRSNVVGGGINTAQRVMQCGDAGHILLSRHLADDLSQSRRWQPYLHDLGEFEVKHGAKLQLVNLHKDTVGNPEKPRKLRRGKWWDPDRRTTPRWKIVTLPAVLLLVALVLGLTIFFRRQATHSPASTPGIASLDLSTVPKKSIAVLPFANLSDDKQNAYFTDGVQDEILTDLSKVADLKVISRTSVAPFKDVAQRNVRKIAEALGVTHVVEGSVQRIGARVRVSAQLIDARTDTHLWAEHYDRDLADVFAIETEVAEQIVAQLRARLSPKEKAALQERPTSDVEAYDLYVHAKALLASSVYVRAEENRTDAVHLLEQAVKRDPNFFLGYCLLANVQGQIYFHNIDHTPARLASAEEAVNAALRLRPESGEAHLAFAEFLYYVYFDFDRARSELMIARNALPNEPRIFELSGYMDRRQGHWEESARNLERALQLDPRNFYNLQQIARSYHFLRRYDDESSMLDRALTVVPGDIGVRLQRAQIELEARANTTPLRQTMETILNEDPSLAEGFVDQMFYVALCDRDWAAAEHVLSIMKDGGYTSENFAYPKSWCEGLVAYVRGNVAAARSALIAARDQMEKVVVARPDFAESLSVLGMIDAGLGNKEKAISEGRRAAELLPATKDAINGVQIIENLAIIYAWSGEKNQALEQLESAARVPSDVTYGLLRLHPCWDNLRGDPRFEKIVTSLAQDAPSP